jgi:hypothetical protein
MGRRILALSISMALSVSASAGPIPADLEARAAELRKQASPRILAWAHDQGVALAKTGGPIDLGALEQLARSQLVKRHARVENSAAAAGGRTYPNLGNLGDADIMALCFIVMMEAAKSAQEDLKAIMGGVKAINNAKAAQRKELNTVSALATTPTPGPDRVSQLVNAARSVHGKTLGASLSTVVPR